MNRRALTLIEVLVVIAIIGIVLATLMPAVQASRESVRRTQCANHLHQVATALLTYESGKGRLPPGYVSAVNRKNEDTGPGWGWGYSILPQLEEQALFDRVKLDRPIEDPVNADVRSQILPIFLCPSDTQNEELWTAMTREVNGAPKKPICDVAPSNFVGVHGYTDPGSDGEGVLFRNSRVRLQDVSDGKSKTLLVGERSHQLGVATWVGAVTGAQLFPDSPTQVSRKRIKPAAGMVLGFVGNREKTDDAKSDSTQFFSQHGIGVNFAFCDGHVTYISRNIDDEVLKALSTRAGGESISREY